MSNQSGAMTMLRSMRGRTRHLATARARVAAMSIAAVIALTLPGAAAESRTTRVSSGVVRSEQLTDELWLHTRVQRLPIFCSNNRTLGGHVTRRTTHEFQAYVTVGPDPNGRRSRVEHLRLRYSVRDQTWGVEDCHNTDWCPARHQGDCGRSCATGEAWEGGRHVVTDQACLEAR